jgi:DNA-directed RNA polymerase specialized sigma24 family protein
VTDTRTEAWPGEQVISAAQQGDTRAIALLLDGSHAHVQRFARTLCSTPEDAEDAAQEALIVLYRKIGTLRATAALASWMFQIVRNECIRRSRSPHRGQSPPPKTPPSPAWRCSTSSRRSRGYHPSSVPFSCCETSRVHRDGSPRRRWDSLAPL